MFGALRLLFVREGRENGLDSFAVEYRATIQSATPASLEKNDSAFGWRLFFLQSQPHSLRRQIRGNRVALEDLHTKRMVQQRIDTDKL